MDDYNSNLLNDSKSEWSIRLMNVLSGHIIDGFRSIFSEAMEVCEKNDEAEKYLMTFQNYLSMIPKWNQNMVNAEVERIKESSQCKYLEDLITCVHILQLKILSCVRTGNQNKKIDIDIPCFKTFLHNVYINIARKLYSNIYLFQIDATPLQQQKHNREFEIIVQTCIMNTIRDNVPVEQLLKQYIDETQEVDVEKTEKVVEEPKQEPVKEENPQDPVVSAGVSPSSIVDSEPNHVVINEPPSSTPAELPPTVDDLFPNTDDVKKEENKSISFENEILEKDNSQDGNNENTLTIGDNVPLVLDNDFDNQNDSNVNELEEINLDFDNIEDETKITGSEPPIDLGIEELTI
jgi:hypothetical protein